MQSKHSADSEFLYVYKFRGWNSRNNVGCSWGLFWRH